MNTAEAIRSPQPASGIRKIAVGDINEHPTVAEHKLLRLRTSRMHILLSNPRAFDTDRWAEMVCWELRELTVLLDHHFAHEEEGGYFADVLEDRPSVAPKLNSLVAQHELMRRELAELTGQAVPPELLAERVARFLETLEMHEHDENRILQESVNVEYGGG